MPCCYGTIPIYSVIIAEKLNILPQQNQQVTLKVKKSPLTF